MAPRGPRASDRLWVPLWSGLIMASPGLGQIPPKGPKQLKTCDLAAVTANGAPHKVFAILNRGLGIKPQQTSSNHNVPGPGARPTESGATKSKHLSGENGSKEETRSP